jgi:hypothetical protein
MYLFIATGPIKTPRIKSMIKRKTIYTIWFVFLSISLFYGISWGKMKPFGFAIPFPDLTFTQTLSKEEQAYLGIPQKTRFSFKEIRVVFWGRIKKNILVINS